MTEFLWGLNAIVYEIPSKPEVHNSCHFPVFSLDTQILSIHEGEVVAQPQHECFQIHPFIQSLLHKYKWKPSLIL